MTTDYKPPWMMKPLDKWNILVINHYFWNSKRLLFVAMSKGNHMIKAEGPDDEYLWYGLRCKAIELSK